jgi:hypothetical protein
MAEPHRFVQEQQPNSAADLRSHSEQHVMRKMIVIESSVNPKAPCILWDTGHFAGTLDAKFVTTAIWCLEKNFNPYIRPGGRAIAAEDERAVYRYIVGETAICVLFSIVPMEDDGEC